MKFVIRFSGTKHCINKVRQKVKNSFVKTCLRTCGNHRLKRRYVWWIGVIHCQNLGLVDHSDENPRRKNKVKRKHPQQEKTKDLNGVAKSQTLEAKVTKGVASQETVDKRVISSLNEKGDVKKANELGEGKVDVKMNLLAVIEESYCYAKDLYVSKGKTTRYSRRKGIKGKKPFVPPLPKARLYLGLAWQPSLASVHELSP